MTGLLFTVLIIGMFVIVLKSVKTLNITLYIFAFILIGMFEYNYLFMFVYFSQLILLFVVKEYREKNPENVEAVVESVPQKRLGQPEEIAEQVSFLLDDEANYINGFTVPIHGEFTSV